MLIICETHPVPYHAPVYSALANQHQVPMMIVYGSDFSVIGYQDAEFGVSFAWDTDLMGGVDACFVRTVAEGGAANRESVTAAGLAAILDRRSPKAILAHGYTHPFDRAAIRWAIKNRVPLLHRAETADHAHNRHPFKSRLRDILLRWLYRRCAALLYVGIRSRAHYKRLGVPDSRLFYSPYCVDATCFQVGPEPGQLMRHETRQQLGIRPDATVILYSGKLSRRKGVNLIGAAIRMLPSSLQSNLHVLFLGDGEMRDQLEREFLHQTPKIPASFPGFQNQTQLSRFYHAADLLVLPSRYGETWGLVVNEALMHGLPCVVSDAVGSQPDLVEPGVTGHVFAGGDPASLSEALSRTLTLCHNKSTPQRCRDRIADYNVLESSKGIADAWHFVTKTQSPL